MDQNEPWSLGDKVVVGIFAAIWAGVMYWLYKDDQKLEAKFEAERQQREEAERKAYEAMAIIDAANETLAIALSMKLLSHHEPAYVSTLDQQIAEFKDAVETLRTVKSQVSDHVMYRVTYSLRVAERLEPVLVEQ